jgi:hypothetical protein
VQDPDALISKKGLSRWGVAGLALFLVHIVLLCLPPLPPDVKGSLWDYLTAYPAVALLLVEWVRRHAAAARGWAGLSAGRRWAIGLGGAAGTFVLALAVRWLSPALYMRFSREEGLWEPLTLFLYLAAALLLLGVAAKLAAGERRHWRLIAGLYLIMGLEEIDYLGIFGGLIGRVQGIYAGSLHDLVILAVEGALSPAAWAIIAALFLLLVIVLAGSGYLQPRAILAMFARADFLWVVVGLGFLVGGAAAEAGLFELAARPPTLEESLELAGAICFFCYALSVAARLEPRAAPAPAPVPSSPSASG